MVKTKKKGGVKFGNAPILVAFWISAHIWVSSSCSSTLNFAKYESVMYEKCFEGEHFVCESSNEGSLLKFHEKAQSKQAFWNLDQRALVSF